MLNQNNYHNFKYIDFHTHLHDSVFDNCRDDIIQNLQSKNIAIITIGTDITESIKAQSLSNKCQNIFYTIGVHPHDNIEADFEEQEFVKLLGDKCVAIGECGLDYFYLKDDFVKLKNNNIDLVFSDFVTQEKNRQKDLFIKQIRFAKKYNKKLMIHGRPSIKDNTQGETYNPDGMDAYIDILNILKQENFDLGGNMHFFAGNIDIAKECIQLGFTFSFGGVLTLTSDYDEVLKYIPIQYIHAETDAPYITPKDKDGQRLGRKIENRLCNTSENIDTIVIKIAEIKNLDKDFVIEKLKENFVKYFLCDII